VQQPRLASHDDDSRSAISATSFASRSALSAASSHAAAAAAEGGAGRADRVGSTRGRPLSSGSATPRRRPDSARRPDHSDAASLSSRAGRLAQPASPPRRALSARGPAPPARDGPGWRPPPPPRPAAAPPAAAPAPHPPARHYLRLPLEAMLDPQLARDFRAVTAPGRADVLWVPRAAPAGSGAAAVPAFAQTARGAGGGGGPPRAGREGPARPLTSRV
jgi:hypothetical protein